MTRPGGWVRFWPGTIHSVAVTRCADWSPPIGPNASTASSRGRSMKNLAVNAEVVVFLEFVSTANSHCTMPGSDVGVTMALSDALGA